MPTEREQNRAFVKSLTPLLKWLERIATAGFIASLATVFLSGGSQMDIARNVFMASAAILSGVYFLNAFMPLDFERDENEKFGMKELVLTTIIPKVLWISAAVCMSGFFVLSQNHEHDAHLNLWFIGGFSLFGSLAILSFAMVTGNKHTRVLAPVAFRAVPLLVLVTYFYLNS
jgi:hypothetical protein